MNPHKPYSHIHFVGIKGVGMAALARVAHDIGITITGSDVADTFITDTMLSDVGIVPTVGFDAGDLPNGVDCVVYGAAHGGADNPQVRSAEEKGIRTITYGKAIQELFCDKKIIAVAGTHGKTTTTAMLATILYTAGCDPSWIIGTGNIPSLPANGHGGSGDYAVVEADEYVDQIGGIPKFLHLNPHALIITSLDWDHPDVFPTHKLFINAFHKLMKRVDAQGVMVLRGDDKELRRLAKLFHGTLRFVLPDKPFSAVKVSVPGLFNRVNATFAARMAHELGISTKYIIQGLAAFKGVERRMQNKGIVNGWLWYDDYAHHPTEIKAALGALREMYPKDWIVVVFQSHTLTRTRALLPDFGKSFTGADHVCIAPIFTSAREKNDGEPIDLVGAIAKHHTHVSAVATPDEMWDVVQSDTIPHGAQKIIVTMGAGDIYQWLKK